MSKGDFPFNFNDVQSLLGLETNSSKSNFSVKCPFCNDPGKHMNLNNVKKVYRCNYCDTGGGILNYYGRLRGLSNKDALMEIQKNLGLDKTLDVKQKRYAAEREKKKQCMEVPMASIEERDKVYNRFLELLSLEDDHKRNLLERGLEENFIIAKKYRTLPTESDELLRIARILLKEGYCLKGIPGFYINKNKDWQLNKHKRGILIPVRNEHNQIQGLQIRKDDNLLKYFSKGKDEHGNLILKKENKFNWLSSPDKYMGSKATTFVHISCAYKCSEKGLVYPVLNNKWIDLTEGPLKADVYSFLTGYPCVAVPGVNALDELHNALVSLKKYGIAGIHLAFDMDYIKNEKVKNGMDKTILLIKKEQLQVVQRTWDCNFKGIDDYALALKKEGITLNWKQA